MKKLLFILVLLLWGAVMMAQNGPGIDHYNDFYYDDIKVDSTAITIKIIKTDSLALETKSAINIYSLQPTISKTRIALKSNDNLKQFQRVSSPRIAKFPNNTTTQYIVTDSTQYKTTKVIYSLMGERLKSFEGEAVDITAFPSGTYLLTLESPKKIITKRIIRP